MNGGDVSGKRMATLESGQVCSLENFSDLYCQLCEEDNRHVEGCAFCVDCQEYLCRGCVQIHKKVRVTKNHVIQDKDAMPRDETPVQQKPRQPVYTVDTDSEQCLKHPGTAIEYYCESHNDIGCSVCVTEGHITCGVGYIPVLSKGTVNSAEYKKLSKKMHHLQKKFMKTKEKTIKSIAEVESKSKEYNKQVRQLGEDIMKIVHTLVQKAVDEKDEFVNEKLEGLKCSQKQSDHYIKEINTMIADLEEKKESENQSFVLMKKHKKKVNEAEDTLRKVRISSKPTQFHFLENSDSVTSVEHLGTLFKYKEVVEQHESINVSTTTDEETPMITSLEVLSDGRLALADHDNMSVKLVDTKSKLVSEIKMETEPWGIAEVSKGQLAVTCPATGILFLDTITSMSHAISAEKGCFGIAVNQDRLFVTFSEPPQTQKLSRVEILNMNGQVLRTYAVTPNGEQLFTDPIYIKVNNKNNVIHVADEKAIISITPEGKVHLVYSDDTLKELMDFVLAEDGSLILCEMAGVHIITADGQKVHSLVDLGQAGARSAVVAYDKNTHRLYLESNRENICVYQLG